jgi:LPXTG-site transpeptidase (sortase) family protein
VALGIPRLGVRSSLVELRLDSSAAMEVPQEPALAGWYGLGPTPGALGPAVIAGHVAWNGTPGVFARLTQLRSGDIVTVSRDDGRTAVFMVTRVIEVSKEHFPTEAVYGPVNHAALRLITCAGDYDEVEHRYADNAVVFARLMDVRGART